MRAIRDEITGLVAEGLAQSVGREGVDAEGALAASMLLATWGVALAEAHDTYRRSGDVRQAEARFLTVIDRGSVGVAAAMTGTPYV